MLAIAPGRNRRRPSEGTNRHATGSQFLHPEPDAAMRAPKRKVMAALTATALIIQPQPF
jgi:hypothetical protein